MMICPFFLEYTVLVVVVGLLLFFLVRPVELRVQKIEVIKIDRRQGDSCQCFFVSGIAVSFVFLTTADNVHHSKREFFDGWVFLS
jgi:hypothetical protein